MDNRNYSGKLIVVDGLDGIGKGVGLDAIIKDIVLRDQKKVLNLHASFSFRYADQNFPDFENPELGGFQNKFYVDPESIDFIYTSEPTEIGVGKMIRTETTVRNGRVYSPQTIAQMFSIDREIQLKRVIGPALRAGKTVIQSRSVSTSIVYQPIQEASEGQVPVDLNYVLSLEGNRYALDNAPDLLIIPTIDHVARLAERLAGRQKKDNSIFENLEFQLKAKDRYESDWFRKIFEDRGTKIEFYDSSISVEHSRSEAVRIFREFMYGS